MVGSAIGLTAGTAGAAGAESHNNTITATGTPPTIPSTGSNNTAGSLKLVLHNDTGKAVHTSHVSLTAHPGTTGSVGWASAPTVGGASITAAQLYGPTDHALSLLVSMTAGKTDTVTVTNVKYDTTAAAGTVYVYATWIKKTGTATATIPSTIGTFGTTTTANTAVNAVATHPTPAATPTETLTATKTPTIKPTGSGQTAGTWVMAFRGTKGDGWSKTETFTITVDEPTGANCTSTPGSGYVVLTGTPTAKVASSKNVSTTPTFVVSTSATGTKCKAVSHNQVTVTFTNTGVFTSTTSGHNSFAIAVSGVKYNVHEGSAQTYGDVAVGITYTTGTSTAPSQRTATTTGPSNADIASVVMTANTPAVTLAPGSYDAAISPVNVIEQVPGSIPSGNYVCITLTGTNDFNAGNAAKASVKSGNGTVTSTVKYYTTGTAETHGTASTAVFKVKSASTGTKASTYTVTGLAVDAADTAGVSVGVVGVYSTTSHCTTGRTGAPAGEAVAFTISLAKSQRIAGSTAAATAAQQLLYEYPATAAHTNTCPGTGASTHTTAGIAKRAIILANETHFPDALSSQYLAGALHTGTLLTKATSIPSVTLNTLRLEGISHVYVIGGDLAVTTTLVNQLETTPSYACGGSSVRHTSSGATRYITVTRISGPTQYDTAQAVATYLAKSFVGKDSFPGAYVGTNKTGGNGKYNDTSGKASSAGLGLNEPTAIVADGQVFQDAMSAGPISYALRFPVLLTTPTTLSPQAEDALSALTIKQVIVMGGPYAVSNTVVTSLEGMGMEVLRIAGVDYTDTAVQTANFEVAGTVTGIGWTPSTSGHMAAVARGNGFSDGLAGAVIAGTTDFPILLTESPASIGSYLTDFLKHAGTGGPGIDQATTATTADYRLYSVLIFGGTLAITPTVVKQIQTDLSTG